MRRQRPQILILERLQGGQGLGWTLNYPPDQGFFRLLYLSKSRKLGSGQAGLPPGGELAEFGQEVAHSLFARETAIEGKVGCFDALTKIGEQLPRVDDDPGWCAPLSLFPSLPGLMAIVKHLRIAGRVQGVGFRYFVERRANELGVTGWVRNRHDGSVEAIAEGERVEELIAWCRRGPPMAEVSEASIKWSEAQGGFTGFRVTR